MQNTLAYIKKKPLTILLLAFLLAIVAEWQHWGMIYVFIFSALGVIPMAGFIGDSTEVLAVYTGPKIGGLLNATLGNAAELIITLIAINAGLLELVKASITGSILGNLLLVMGVAMMAGGLKNGIQVFDRRQISNHSILLLLSVVALIIPSLFYPAIGNPESIKVEVMSIGVAIVMIVLYVLGLIFSLKAARSPIVPSAEQMSHNAPHWSKTKAIIVLAAATLGVVIASELLVGAVETVVVQFGISEFFLGIILIPIVGNVAEHLVAVTVAYRNQMELSVEIAVSSSLQIALFVAPLLVFVSLALGNPLTLVFNTFELIALTAAILITALVSMDGESNWLEGAALLSVYIILAISFFLLPSFG
ncbi:MAG TPA: calcium/proton exchanger [Bellilinea sp.]|nr:calcium/proton exchanger [Bellilinea sp.]